MAMIINESFTTGAAPSGWGGGPDYGYATSPAPLEGSYSAYADPGLGGTSPGYNHGSAISAEQWGHHLFHPTGLPSSFQSILSVRESDFDLVFQLVLNSTGTVTIDGSGAFETTVGTMAADTTYHVWWRYKPSTGGNNGQMEVWFNTSDDRAGSPANNHQSYSSGTNTNGVQYVTFPASGSGPEPYIIDTVQWADTDEFAGGGGGGVVIPIIVHHLRQQGIA
jgi:hypothetical protein